MTTDIPFGLIETIEYCQNFYAAKHAAEKTLPGMDDIYVDIEEQLTPYIFTDMKNSYVRRRMNFILFGEIKEYYDQVDLNNLALIIKNIKSHFLQRVLFNFIKDIKLKNSLQENS
jgi:hypothetical protein